MHQMLKRYSAAQKELELLEQEFSFCAVTDTVKGSMIGYPYIERVMTVTGIDPDDSRRLCAKRTMLKSLIHKVDRFYAEINDPIIGAAIKLHYMNDKTWIQVADELGGSDMAIRQTVHRYLKSCHTCHKSV